MAASAQTVPESFLQIIEPRAWLRSLTRVPPQRNADVGIFPSCTRRRTDQSYLQQSLLITRFKLTYLPPDVGAKGAYRRWSSQAHHFSKPHTGYSIERTNWIRQNERHLMYAFDLCNKVSLMRLVAAAARFEADPQLVARLVCSCVSLAGVGLLSAVSRAANFARFASVPSSKRSMLLSLAIFSSRLRARAAFAIFRAILFAFLSSRVVSGLPCSGVIRFPLRVADTFMLLFNSGPKRIVAKSAAVHPSPTPRPPKDASPPSRTRRRRGRPWPPPVAWCRLGVERCVCVVLCFLECAACLRLVQGCPDSACHP